MEYEGSNMHLEKGFKTVVPQQARKWSAASRPKVTLGDFIIPTINRFKALEPNESGNSHVFLGNSSERRFPTCSDTKHNPTTVEHGRKVCADARTTRKSLDIKRERTKQVLNMQQGHRAVCKTEVRLPQSPLHLAPFAWPKGLCSAI